MTHSVHDSIFTKIIRGAIPAHKIYEDEKVIAFLDLFPVQPGHTLVVPKAQVDKFYELADQDYFALFHVVKDLSAHMERILGKRITMQVIGVDVPHAHVHLIPASNSKELRALPSTEPAKDEILAEMARSLRMH